MCGISYFFPLLLRCKAIAGGRLAFAEGLEHSNWPAGCHGGWKFRTNVRGELQGGVAGFVKLTVLLWRSLGLARVALVSTGWRGDSRWAVAWCVGGRRSAAAGPLRSGGGAGSGSRVAPAVAGGFSPGRMRVGAPRGCSEGAAIESGSADAGAEASSTTTQVADFVLGPHLLLSADLHVFNADDLVAFEANELDIVRRSAVDPFLIIFAIAGFADATRGTAHGVADHFLIHADQRLVALDGLGEQGRKAFLKGLGIVGGIEVDDRREKILDVGGGEGGCVILDGEKDEGTEGVAVCRVGTRPGLVRTSAPLTPMLTRSRQLL